MFCTFSYFIGLKGTVLGLGLPYILLNWDCFNFRSLSSDMVEIYNYAH